MGAEANGIANRLIRLGGRSGCVVTVLLRDRIRLVATLLGVFQADAVYVPLNPDAPDERLRELIQEIRPDFLVTESAEADRLSAAIAEKGMFVKKFVDGTLGSSGALI